MTPYEKELELNNIGYDIEYLETLSNNAIERLYAEEFEEQTEEQL